MLMELFTDLSMKHGTDRPSYSIISSDSASSPVMQYQENSRKIRKRGRKDECDLKNLIQMPRNNEDAITTRIFNDKICTSLWHIDSQYRKNNARFTYLPQFTEI